MESVNIMKKIKVKIGPNMTCPHCYCENFTTEDPLFMSAPKYIKWVCESCKSYFLKKPCLIFLDNKEE